MRRDRQPPRCWRKALDSPLIRLQCYEGLDRQRGAVRLELASVSCSPSGWPRQQHEKPQRKPICSSVEFLQERPILQVRSGTTGPLAVTTMLDRRGGPGRQRVRGAPAGVPRRRVCHGARARHLHRQAATEGRRTHLQPHPRPARRPPPAMSSITGWSIPKRHTRAVEILRRSSPVSDERAVGRVSDPVRGARSEQGLDSRQATPGSPRRSTGSPALSVLGASLSSCARGRAADPGRDR